MRLVILLLTMVFPAALMFGGETSSPEVANPVFAHFPELKASNLEGRSFALPADFEGERNLLLIAFQREQQQQIDTWLKEMKRFEGRTPACVTTSCRPSRR